MRRTLLAAVVAALVFAFGATAAFGDGAQTIAPNSKQTTSILKAWSFPSGKYGPTKCYAIRISKPVKNEALWAGMQFNSKASGCTKYGFDGSSIFYGTGNRFYLLTGASSMDATTCKATALVMGPNAWANLVDSGVAALGCQNID